MNDLHCGDCLDVLPRIGDDSVDLIYLDPPFCNQKDWGQFDDRWKLEGDPVHSVARLAAICHSGGLAAYLDFMAPRLEALRRVLKPTGTIYLHCDFNAAHYLKILLDVTFGRSWWRGEIIWRCIQRNAKQPAFQRLHENIFHYAGPGATWNQLYEPVTNPDSVRERGCGYQVVRRELVVIFDRDAPEVREKMPRWKMEGRRFIDHTDDECGQYGKMMTSIWTDVAAVRGTSTEVNGYPTQKPLALLRRIITASSNPGDLVLDPFCGSGTTMVAAKDMGRRYIGIDRNARAIELAATRLAAPVPEDLPETDAPPVKPTPRQKRTGPSFLELAERETKK